MVCRDLRKTFVIRWLLGGFLCLALLGSMAISTPSLSGRGDVASIELRAPEFPFAALGTVLAVRFQKHAQKIRVTLQKPERSVHLSSTERGPALLPRPSLAQRLSLLPRRSLHSRQAALRTPNDSVDPFLASPSLS
jgi:hypothetical protein